jgi:hypothetical protein
MAMKLDIAAGGGAALERFGGEGDIADYAAAGLASLVEEGPKRPPLFVKNL